MITQEKIIKYYENTEIDYKNYWNLDSCQALHYGFWQDDVKNLKIALKRENEVLAKISDINSEDIVLDAGSGVGGSSIYLAKHFGCKVKGITLVENQCQTSKINAIKNDLSHLVSFDISDYNNTKYRENTFSVVWFIESICHSQDIELTIKEAFRILKPSGRILIADLFVKKIKLAQEEKKLFNQWLSKWAIKELVHINDMENILNKCGFINIRKFDFTHAIFKSSHKLYKMVNYAMIYGKIIRFFGKHHGNAIRTNNAIGAKLQYVALKKELWSYNIIIAEKKS